VPVVEGKPRPYKDTLETDGVIRYRYRGTDPQHRDNRGLRLAMQRNTPLIYFFGLVPGRYLSVWPAYIVGDDPAGLDAAHILPDRHPQGEPWVSNGLALCKLHHAAFESNILGIRPDLIVEVRSDILDEDDGPMLLHGIKECHNRPLMIVPGSTRLRPRRDFLEIRYADFRNAT
jgi:hypothetical protein